MTPEDIAALRAAIIWARANGWTQGHRGWINARYDSDATIAVGHDYESVRVWRRPEGIRYWPLRSSDYPVANVRQGVDLLCVLGVLPAWMSSQWNDGVSAGVQLAGTPAWTAVSAA